MSTRYGNRRPRRWRMNLLSVRGQKASCPRKEGYPTKALAEAAAVRTRAKRNFVVRPGYHLFVYQCAGCGRWKVGNKLLPIPRVRGGRRKAG